MEVYKTENPNETKRLGRILAKSLLNLANKSDLKSRDNRVGVRASSGATILALFGELGSGKTTFVKGLVQGLGVREKVTSPTYVFVRSYTIPSLKTRNRAEGRFYHLDLYRMVEADLRILDSFEFKEIVKDPLAIVAVEWAEKLKPFGLKINPTLIIEFGYTSSLGREVKYIR